MMELKLLKGLGKKLLQPKNGDVDPLTAHPSYGK